MYEKFYCVRERQSSLMSVRLACHIPIERTDPLILPRLDASTSAEGPRPPASEAAGAAKPPKAARAAGPAPPDRAEAGPAGAEAGPAGEALAAPRHELHVRVGLSEAPLPGRPLEVPWVEAREALGGNGVPARARRQTRGGVRAPAGPRAPPPGERGVPGTHVHAAPAPAPEPPRGPRAPRQAWRPEPLRHHVVPPHCPPRGTRPRPWPRPHPRPGGVMHEDV